MSKPQLHCNIGDIVYVILPRLKVMPARREVVAIHITAVATTYTLRNNRTGEVEIYTSNDFGNRIFVSEQDAIEKMKENAHV